MATVITCDICSHIIPTGTGLTGSGEDRKLSLVVDRPGVVGSSLAVDIKISRAGYDAPPPDLCQACVGNVVERAAHEATPGGLVRQGGRKE